MKVVAILNRSYFNNKQASQIGLEPATYGFTAAIKGPLDFTPEG
ncbi:hypothetical protein ACFLXP_04910 [Chloroflexota bacterium]